MASSDQKLRTLYLMEILLERTDDEHMLNRLFDKQVEYFDGKYNIIVWDAPAHASSWSFRFDFDLFDKAKWLNGILEKEEIIKPIIIGQSMGGYVGQAYAQLYPDRLAGFISIDSAPLQRNYVTAV